MGTVLYMDHTVYIHCTWTVVHLCCTWTVVKLYSYSQFSEFTLALCTGHSHQPNMQHQGCCQYATWIYTLVLCAVLYYVLFRITLVMLCCVLRSCCACLVLAVCFQSAATYSNWKEQCRFFNDKETGGTLSPGQKKGGQGLHTRYNPEANNIRKQETNWCNFCLLPVNK